MMPQSRTSRTRLRGLRIRLGVGRRTEGHGHSRQTPPGSTLGAGKGMGLNMCRQSIVDVPLDLKRELEEFERTNDRSVLIKALRDQLLIARYDSATLVEKSRIAALEILQRIPVIWQHS